MITIRTVSEEIYDKYSVYLASRPEARFGHDLAWAMALRDTYGVSIQHLAALDGENVVGICPFFLCKPIFGGAHYVTNPFPTYCGPVYDSMEALGALLSEVKIRTATVQSAEVLTPVALPEDGSTSLPFKENLDYTYRLSLDKGIDEIFEALSRDYKRILRKSDALSDMELIVDSDGKLLEPFHRLYVSVYAGKHGFIPHTRKLFQNIFKYFPPGIARIYLAKIKGQFTGAMFTFWAHNEVYYGWSAVLPDTVYHPTHFLIWKIIQDAAAEGYDWFNMGEAARDHHGLNHFKRGWGTEVLEPCRYFIPGKLTKPSPRLFDRVSWSKKIIARLPSSVVTTFLSPAIRYFL